MHFGLKSENIKCPKGRTSWHTEHAPPRMGFRTNYDAPVVDAGKSKWGGVTPKVARAVFHQVHERQVRPTEDQASQSELSWHKRCERIFRFFCNVMSKSTSQIRWQCSSIPDKSKHCWSFVRHRRSPATATKRDNSRSGLVSPPFTAAAAKAHDDVFECADIINSCQPLAIAN